MLIDYELLVRELLVALRGPRTQSQLSRRLGARYNIVHRWEAGLRKPSWSDFQNLCAACKVDLASAVTDGLRVPGGATDAASVARHIFGQHSQTQIAEWLRTSRHMVRRWLAGECDPDLDLVIHAISRCARMLFPFLARLTDPARLPSVAEGYFKHLDNAAALGACPDLASVYAAFSTWSVRTAERGQLELISARTGLSLDRIRELIDLLVAVGTVEVEGERLIHQPAGQVEARGDLVQARLLRVHWFERALAKFKSLSAPPASELYGYLVAPVAQSTFAEVRARYLQFWNEVQSIIRNQEESEVDEVALMCFQFVNLNPDKN